MKPCELATSITAIACTITTCYPKEELPVLASIFTQLGDTITTIIAQEEACGEGAEE